MFLSIVKLDTWEERYKRICKVKAYILVVNRAVFSTFEGHLPQLGEVSTEVEDEMPLIVKAQCSVSLY